MNAFLDTEGEEKTGNPEDVMTQSRSRNNNILLTINSSKQQGMQDINADSKDEEPNSENKIEKQAPKNHTGKDKP